MPNTVSVNEIVEVRSGYTFRKATAEPEAGELLGLHIGDIRHASVIDPSQLAHIELQSSGRPTLLMAGDVVLAAKGSHNRAALFLDEHRQVVPSNQFLVLSIRNRQLTSPAFLCWMLNYENTQKKLAEYRTGTNIFSISKKALQSLELALPSIEAQEKILRMHDSWEEEQRLTEALTRNREAMLHGMFQQLLNGAGK